MNPTLCSTATPGKTLPGSVCEMLVSLNKVIKALEMLGHESTWASASADQIGEATADVQFELSCRSLAERLS